MKQKKLKERGITLIALVITIILLLILAGVTLKIVLDGNFVDKTQEAVDKYSEAQKNETEQIKYFLENYLGEVDNIEGTEHRTLNGEKPAYNNPIIPVGFKTSSEGASWSSIDGKTIQGWNDGLVIEDKEGNQFVWVPVDGINVKYEKWCTKGISYTNTQDDTLPSGITNENDQITKYGGFYIGRYEAGTELEYDLRNTVTIPLSKKNKDPWNNVSWTNAKQSAETMYTENKVQSGLITGTMWDTVMLWLKNAGINVETDCRDWGNYKNAEVTGITKYSIDYGKTWLNTDSLSKKTNESWLLPTGNTSYTKRKNIYDLAGNVYEWTNEGYSSVYVRRGGSVDDNDPSPAAYRANHSDKALNFVGFRVILYIQ